MTELKRILLVEDNANDVELMLEALEENRLANEVIVVRDGQEALDYLFRRGPYRLRAKGQRDLLIKPINLERLLAVVRQYCPAEATLH